MVGADQNRSLVDRGVRFARSRDVQRHLQPDRDDVRRRLFGDRRERRAEPLLDREMGEREVSERQQRVHWFFSHLADVLVLVLLAGFIVYVVYAWGPM